MAQKRIIVVGGGAAGLMAAGQAALNGAATTILEKKERPGRKLRITGKGRCNLTNNAPLTEFIGRFSAGGKFLRQAFSRFFTPDLIEFFARIGVATELERGGRVFPENNDAKKVAEALDKWARDCGVDILTHSSVQSLIIKNGQLTEIGVTDRNGNSSFYNTDAVIIATGGASYPATGSTGDGYRLAESVGHTIISVRPSLVPVETAGDTALRLQGVSLRNVSARLWINGKKKDERFGEMLFTHFGLSGPIILSLSRQIVDAVRTKAKIELSIDLKPALSEDKLDQRLLRDLDSHGKQKFSTLLKALLPRKLVPICSEMTKIDPDKSGHQISAPERKRLGRWLKDFRFEISGYRPFEEAIITAGGVDTKEINPRTMESLLVKGLYFAGEVMDIDADTGGFNLQAAFSTGWLAGLSAALAGS
ncbi:MAG: aminoacetone oxidase family FAD-binding enzyme [candidate division Zixibacteria bacterium HGW-Zixibacteria-1]|nr:MAG: aminoacetone oxidase family FAD-binding enzyme [candidate division Zixibacteria bacterium HGW-Zixibacteria-1]